MAHELYNQLSKYVDASYRRTKNYQQEVDFILRRTGKRAGIVIDVACGSSRHAELLRKAGFEVYAVDAPHPGSYSPIAAFLLRLRQPPP